MLCVLASAVVSAAPSFSGLGRGPAGVSSVMHAMTPDGSVAVGQVSTFNGGGFEACRWTPQGGFQLLGFVPARELESKALGISPEGQFVVGYSRATGEGVSPRRRAFIWKTETGMVGLPHLDDTFEDSAAHGVSALGGRVVGYSKDSTGRNKPVFWTREGLEWKITEMVDVDPKWISGEAWAVTPDGTRIAGFREFIEFPANSYNRGFLWVEGGGTTVLEPVESHLHCWGYALSANGQWVVGQSHGEPVRWSAAGTLFPLGPLSPFSSDRYTTFAITPNGDVVAGATQTLNADDVAFTWDQANGTRSVKSNLLTAGASAVADWRLLAVTAVSADGRILLGNGVNPNALGEAWIVNLNGGPLGGPVLTAAPATGNKVGLQWITVAGFTYTIEARESADSGTWTVVGQPKVGDGSIATFEVEAGTGKMFFRLVKQPTL
jgi:uncharacterized membrane protein